MNNVLMLWSHGVAFLEQLNQFPVVQFTWSISNTEVKFLAVDITGKQDSYHFRSYKTNKPHAILALFKFPSLPH